MDSKIAVSRNKLLLLACLFPLLVLRASAQSPHISSSGPPSAGGQHCVVVTPSGSGAVGISVEINGVPVPSGRVTKTKRQDGSVLVCFPIPAGTEGGTITVTATEGGTHNTHTATIS